MICWKTLANGQIVKEKSGSGTKPIVGPQGLYDPYEYQLACGGDAYTCPTFLRAANCISFDWHLRVGLGVRFIRTGTENPGPLAGSRFANSNTAIKKDKGKKISDQ